MKSEHEIMLERLQKWKTSATKKQAGVGGRGGKQATVGLKKPLHAANTKNVTMTKKTQQAGRQSLKKKELIHANGNPIKARRQLPQSPETPMSKKLERWKAKKGNEQSVTKGTKRPWRGGGTPLINTGKRSSRQTPADCKTSAMFGDELKNSKQRRSHNLSCTRPTTTEKQGKNGEQNWQHEQTDPVPPFNLSPSSSPHNVSNFGAEQDSEQVTHGLAGSISLALYPGRVSITGTEQDFEAEQDLEHVTHGLAGSTTLSPCTSNTGVEQDLTSTVDRVQSAESEEILSDDECDFVIHSTLETVMSIDTRNTVTTPSTSLSDRPSFQGQKHQSATRSAGKRSVGKSALKQVNKVARTERRSVKFTTPVRCSPRLAKVGEGATATPSVTPKKKIDMRDRLQQWLIEKGKTPSRYSHLLNFQKNTPADRRRREKRRSHTPTPARPHLHHVDVPDGEVKCSTQAREELNATLNECLTLLHEGCPVDHVNNWLDDISRRLPMVEQCAKYWLCRATATELDGADYHDVVGVFEEAAEAGAQPVDEIKEALKDFVIRMGKEDHEETKDITPSSTPTFTPPSEMMYTSPELQVGLFINRFFLSVWEGSREDMLPFPESFAT
ncbi:uncharacterized protein [Amphiura filiformis]|uniref:uncharacterized protein n=1 Tax=Amphiura filiformis TaxID=82378 RepID=UPI003B228821